MNRTSEVTFEVRVELPVDRPPAEVYAVLTDLPRSGEWSAECTGGSWVSGLPAEVGSVFRGENYRGPDVVPWAPVVRGRWVTESEVVTAEPGVSFSWAMRDSEGRAQDSVWGFDIEPRADGGSVVTHRFRMGTLTEGMRQYKAMTTDDEHQRFLREWGAKLECDMAETLERLRTAIEKS